MGTSFNAVTFHITTAVIEKQQRETPPGTRVPFRLGSSVKIPLVKISCHFIEHSLAEVFSLVVIVALLKHQLRAA